MGRRFDSGRMTWVSDDTEAKAADATVENDGLDTLVDIVKDMTVAEIKAAIDSGQLDATEVVEAEKQGKNRATVLALAPEPEQDSTEGGGEADPETNEE